MERMTAGKFRHLPVVEQGRLAGIISIGDVVKHRLQEMEHEQNALRDYIQTGLIVFRPAVAAAGDSAAIASSTRSSARSVARAPISIASCARWKSNQPIWPMRGLISHVRRIAGEARAGDAVLHDVEGVDHHGRDARAGRRCRRTGA